MRPAKIVQSLDKRAEPEIFGPAQDAAPSLRKSKSENRGAHRRRRRSRRRPLRGNAALRGPRRRGAEAGWPRARAAACDGEKGAQSPARACAGRRRPVEEAAARAPAGSAGRHQTRERRLRQRTAEARVEPVRARLPGLREVQRDAGLVQHGERPERAAVGDRRGLDRFDRDPSAAIATASSR